MKLAFASVVTVALLAACARTPPAPGGLEAGRFVTMSCGDGKSFQVRYAEDGRTVRVRAHPGSAELDRQSDGVFVGEGYSLNLKGEGGVSLDHAGKSQGKACKRAG
jgi:hypothetical protein